MRTGGNCCVMHRTTKKFEFVLYVFISDYKVTPHCLVKRDVFAFNPSTNNDGQAAGNISFTLIKLDVLPFSNNARTVYLCGLVFILMVLKHTVTMNS